MVKMKKVEIRLARLRVEPKPTEVRLFRSLKDQLLEIYEERDLTNLSELNGSVKVGKEFTVTLKRKNEKKVKIVRKKVKVSSPTACSMIKEKLVKIGKGNSHYRKKIKVSFPTAYSKIKEKLVKIRKCNSHDQNYQIPFSVEEMEADFERDRPIPAWAKDDELEKTLPQSQNIDPDFLFPEPESPDLDQIFPDTSISSQRNIWKSPVKSPVNLLLLGEEQ